MSEGEWDKYRRTGVMHVLVVSGQHLVILAAFLWFVLRLAMVRRHYAAVLIVTFLILYAALTGGRPPVIRALVMVCIYCGAIFLTRIPLTLNTFALAWLVVFAFDPKDIFDLGCQLSFLSVAVLYWCSEVITSRERDPLEQLVDQTRGVWERVLRRLGRQILITYVITFAVAITVFPLNAAHYHLIPWVGILIGPLVVCVSSVAVISGFLLLFAAAIHLPFQSVFAHVCDWSIGACEAIVGIADHVSFSHLCIADVSAIWLVVFYLGLGIFLFSARRPARWPWATVAGLAWLCLGLFSSIRTPPEQLRCTFLAVGHGGCTVLETPDGRVLLYDAGAMKGPEVTQRQIAPFLWSRGIRRLDEVFVSHADLDHFNGIPALLERFAVGQISCTPTFAGKAAPGVRSTLDAIKRQGVPLRIVKAGDVLQAGDVQINVLHPPLHGPEGRENFRSMVLHIEHRGQTMLLTGDLEGPGLERVVTQPLPQATVLMAPHHGSRSGDSNEQQHRAALIRLTQPRVIISSQDRPRSSSLRPNPYEIAGVPYLATWPHGAITFHFRAEALAVETYRSQKQFAFPASEYAVISSR